VVKTPKGPRTIFKKPPKAGKIVFKEFSKNFQKALMSSPANHFYEFGPFLLDASERLLMLDGQPVHLTPKEFETLLALVRGGGRVQKKSELLKEIWPDTFVGEATLAQNIFTLRKTLAERGGGQTYIETVPRRGYRFVAPVRERREATTNGGEQTASSAPPAPSNGTKSDGGDARAEAELSDAAPSEATAANATFAATTTLRNVPTATAAPHAASPAAAAAVMIAPAVANAPDAAAASPSHAASLPSPAGRERPARAAFLIALVAVLAFASLVYVVWRFAVRPEVAPRPAAFQEMKITRLPVTGDVYEAVISPDGKYLAYLAPEPDRRGMSIWVRQVSTASNIQRIVEPSDSTGYGGLLFSPDGEHVYFGAHKTGDRAPALHRVPALGGTVVKVLDNVGTPISFSPDGRSFVFGRGDFGEGVSLHIADVSGGRERPLAPDKTRKFVGLPAWSPDGRTVACVYGLVENFNGSVPDLGVTSFNVADGAEKVVTPERWVGISQLTWLPGGDELVISAIEQELSPSQIWRLSFPSGEVRRVTNDLNTYFGASLTTDGAALVTVHTDRVPNLWVAPGGDAARARQVTSGAGKFDGYYGVSWTPDGRIVYASVASGSWDIWVMDADGTNQRQLTVGARSNYGPSVSADGRYIVFVSNRAGASFNVWRMDADGANPKQLTFGRGENFAHVTPDGRWVVYATVGYGHPNAVWKVPIDGGEPVALTGDYASWPFVSPDGKSFVCVYSATRNEPPKLAVFPIEGGRPTKLFDIDAPTFRANTVWLPDNRGIAFLDERTGVRNVWMQPLDGGKPVQLTDFKSDGVAGYDWSRDGRLAASRSVETTSVILIRDFR
jgi:Tol biopolymer transport system component/DNA-binding winged helix-turn-helix (wHTH) protein